MPNRTHPQTRHRHKQHEEVQPALVGERNPENLRPESVRRHHRVGLFSLGRLKGSEGVGVLTIFEQGVLHGGTVDGTQQRSTQYPRHTHHVEGVQGPVVEALEEQQEAEDRRYAEAGAKNQLD
jgi:hypothetical protein